jgi:protein-S-isoprenylcysteine O-methyltransferase Ste14
MTALETKVPPPVVALALGALAWWVSAAVAVTAFPVAVPPLVAAAVGLAGLLVEVAGIVSFVRARTSADPTHPRAASTLVVTGIYGLTRNPMYVGDAVMLLAWALYLSNALAFATVPLFILYMDRLQIAPEERAMSECFGDAYAEYRFRVRRWV